MIELDSTPELVVVASVDTVVSNEVEQSVVEVQGSDVLVLFADVVPEIIEVS